MLSDKELKKKYKKEFERKILKYYPVDSIKELGFKQGRCQKCKRPFWSIDPNQRFCGDANCSGGFRFIGNSPAKNKLSFVQVWQRYSKILGQFGYVPIKRYPVVARWRDDIPFVEASIDDFIPYVVSGEVEPPANPLTIPQFCIRFVDIDSVGLSGHFTGFSMLGMHRFEPPKNYDFNTYLKEFVVWLTKGMGIPLEEFTLHPDIWAGSGRFGPCIEFFSRGLEIANQVYMQYAQTGTGYKELNIKVLDMGQGQERAAWFTQGVSTSYEATFPTVIKKLKATTGLKIEKNLFRRFLPYSSYLNIDEIENVDMAWKQVASNIGISVNELKEKILPLAALYSIAEHSRTLLVAINDGALPSNIGGGYNLRILLRRALSFIDKYNFNIYLPDLCREHARYLKPLYPELMGNLKEITEIIEVEKNKYENTKQKTKQIAAKIVIKDSAENELIKLYDSFGITPELIEEEARKFNKSIKIPEDFYAKVAARHEKKEKEKVDEKKLNLAGIEPTNVLYHENYKKTSFRAKVVKVINNNVILDRTYFYATAGGQAHDTGTINKIKVTDVFKQGNIVAHVLEKPHKFKKGEEVECKIDFDRRLQLAQHHTSAHIINAATRKVLGKHINQAGAKKDIDKAHLDITHYQTISDEELKKIEAEANKIVRAEIPVHSRFMLRNEAEKRYGMSIYQGGAVPGKRIRIIEIPAIDVEACGGTHVQNTAEIKTIKILKSTKVHDGVARIVYVAGKAAEQEGKEESGILEETAKILDVKPTEVPSRAEELFKKWKLARKAVKKKRKISLKEFELISKESEKLSNEELLKKTAQIFKTQPEHVPKTAKRFLKELEEFKKNLL